MREVENYGGMYSSLDDIIENLGGTDDEDFLSSVPLEVLLQSIDKQFEDPEEYINNDFVQAFVDNIEFIRVHPDDEVMDETDVVERRELFILHMVKSFEKWLGLGVNEIEGKPDAEQDDIIQYVYRFFLLDIKKNFTNLVLNYIDDHRDEIYELFKDASSASKLVFKNEINDEFDITVLSNLGPVVNHILNDVRNNLDDCTEFFRLCEGNSASENLESTRNYFNDFIICGNFIDSYIGLLNDDLLDTIKSKVRNKILKKYPKRKNINPIEVETEEVVEDTATE